LHLHIKICLYPEIAEEVVVETLLAGLRAAGEATRLRLLHALGQSDLTVSELTQILGQSQPRISRHLKLMVEAGLLERHREGAWVFYRLADRGDQQVLVKAICDLIPSDDPEISRDGARLLAVREERRAGAADYFAKIAPRWDEIRSRHVPEAEVEAAILNLLVGKNRQGRLGRLVDLGTGTGRMLEILSPFASEAIGVDQSVDMLGIARANLDAFGARHLRVRHGDIYNVPIEARSADAVVLHQVLHFLDNPAAAVAEAARLLAPNGALLIVDFAPHEVESLRAEQAHRRLGFGNPEVTGWCKAAGLRMVTTEYLVAAPAQSPMSGHESLTVSLWLARADKMPAAVPPNQVQGNRQHA
jgi:SAM-dependent methyltransferase/DNA-binding transcriptional ArsR family regulator